MILFARRKGFSPFSLFDVIGASCGMGILLGRISNLINAELYGSVSDAPWAVVFPNTDGLPRHPSQLYEAGLEGLILFGVLLILIFKFKKLHFPGFVGGAWVLGYALSRLVIEFFRQPDAHIGYLAGGWLTMGMILSLPMVVIGAWSMISSKTRTPWHSRTEDQAET